jgi:hypothetical protein
MPGGGAGSRGHAAWAESTEGVYAQPNAHGEVNFMNPLYAETFMDGAMGAADASTDDAHDTPVFLNRGPSFVDQPSVYETVADGPDTYAHLPSRRDTGGMPVAVYNRLALPSAGERQRAQQGLPDNGRRLLAMGSPTETPFEDVPV